MIHIGLRAWNCAAPREQRHAAERERRIDIAQRKERERSRHLLIEHEEQDDLQRQDQCGKQAGTFARIALQQHVAEDRQDGDARGVHARHRHRFVLQDEHGRQAECDSTRRDRRQTTPAKGQIIRYRADMAQRPTHHEKIQQAYQHASAAHGERGVPAPVVLDPGCGQHRNGRTDIDRHVVDGERAVEARVVTFVDTAHEIRRVRLEEAISHHDHAKRGVHVAERVDRHREHQVAGAQHERTDNHRAARAKDLVADPPADGRRRVGQRGECAPREVGVFIGETDLADHEQDQQRSHAVITETLPHLDEKNSRE
jgi:hypothetical protein